jgi:nicotinate-nucleotide adenylyltransferase
MLVKQIPFLVFPRYGYPSEPIYENMTVLGHKALIASNISSTKVRERIKMNLPIAAFVPQGIEEYIQKHKVYKNP